MSKNTSIILMVLLFIGFVLINYTWLIFLKFRYFIPIIYNIPFIIIDLIIIYFFLFNLTIKNKNNEKNSF